MLKVSYFYGYFNKFNKNAQISFETKIVIFLFFSRDSQPIMYELKYKSTFCIKVWFNLSSNLSIHSFRSLWSSIMKHFSFVSVHPKTARAAH